MKQGQSRSDFFQRPVVVTVFTIAMDFIFFYMFARGDAGFQNLMVITLAVFLNVFYIFYIRMSLYLSSKSDYKNYKKYLSAVIDDMEYVAPYDEVTSALNSEPVMDDATEEEEDKATVELMRPKEVIEKEPVFDQPIQTEKYCDDLQAYMADNGLSVDKRAIREMFASIAASKMVVFTNEHPEVSERFIELFSEFIGADYSLDEDAFDSGLEADPFSEGRPLKECLYTSAEDKNTIHMLAYNHVDLDSFQNDFNQVIECASTPELPCEIQNRGFQMKDPVPGNLWFFIIARDFDVSRVGNPLAKAAVMLDLKAKPVKPKEQVHQNPLKLSYEHMMNLLSEGYDTHYLTEEDWKRFDTVEQYLSERSSFFLDNKLFRQLERYTSTFLMFGGDHKDAMDSVLHSKLLRLIHTIDVDRNKESEGTKDDILSVFEQAFGLENIPWSKTLLKALGERMQKTVQ